MSKFLMLGLAGLNSAHALLSCDTSAFSEVLSKTDQGKAASVVYAAPIANGGSSFDPNPEFPINAIGLPELCAVKVTVKSSATSSYNFGLFLPASWNSRMLTTGNGGFSGGINVSDPLTFAVYMAELQ